MDNNIANLVFEHLKAIRADVQDLKADNRDIKMRLSAVGHSLASVVLGLGEGYSSNARQQAAIDRMNQRILRIEKRLELADQ